jgi:2-amino-4-hydroxy-6-hydroxymethyldihydropteridine diphosphokinase
MARVFLGLGSNRGDRSRNIKQALRLINEKVTVLKISSFIRTPPREGVRGGWFLNGALEGMTSLEPQPLLSFLQDIEEKLGRKTRHPAGDNRSIDLDILYYGRRILKQARLRIPHPRLRHRDFVLKPLTEIAPELADPECGKTIRELYHEGCRNN